MTNLQVFNQDTANDLFNSNEAFPIAFDDAWAWLEYSARRSGMEAFLLCEFAESLDFVVTQEKVNDESKFGGYRTDKVYSLTIDCFKSWAMMSKTEAGKQVRKYFLECERVAKQKAQTQLPQTYLQALEALVASEKVKEELSTQLIEAAPKIQFSDKVEACPTLCTIGDYLKAQGWGRTLGFSRLRELGVIMEHGTLPYQKYIQAGYFTIHTNSFGFQSARITGKGQVWLSPKL